MMSWMIMARLDWACIHQPHAYTFVLSENLVKASAQVERVATIQKHYPPWYRDLMGLTGFKPLLRGAIYPNASVLSSVPQSSGRAAASYVPTMGLSDEADHQEYFSKNWSAIKGCMDNRSQIFATSSINPGQFVPLVDDTMDGRHGGRAETLHESQGLSIWVNRINRVACASAHYSADPGKRSAEWKQQASVGISKWQWDREMEMRRDSRGGLPVFPMLDRAVHITEGRVIIFPTATGRGGQIEWRMKIEGRVDQFGDPVISRVRLLLALDHGTTNYGAAVWVAVDDDFDWVVYRVYYERDRIASQHAAAISRLCWHEGIGAYERYQIMAIDAMMSRQDMMGKVESIYQSYVDERGQRPLAGLITVRKGAGSRQSGIDRIVQMLYSTRLAVLGPDAPCWGEEGIEPFQFPPMLEHSSLYLAKDVCEPLFDEMQAARYDEPVSKDPDANQPETTQAMRDHAIDGLRYLTDLGAHLIRQRRDVTLAGARQA